MRELQYERGSSLNWSMFVGKVLLKVVSLFGKGLSLGFVLFAALSTLSLLNRSMDFFSSASKMSAYQNQQVLHPGLPVSQRGMIPPSRNGAYTHSEKEETKNARDMIRESGYLVNAVESFTHSLARFSK